MRFLKNKFKLLINKIISTFVIKVINKSIKVLFIKFNHKFIKWNMIYETSQMNSGQYI